MSKKCLLKTTGGVSDHYAMRSAVSIEKVISNQSLPPFVKPTHARLLKRKSFFLGSKALPGEVFRYDLSLTWSGSTKQEALEAMRTAEPTLEVEVECLQFTEYVQQFGTARLADSLLSKIEDLLEVIASHGHSSPRRAEAGDAAGT
jgi:hypothetical protein